MAICGGSESNGYMLFGCDAEWNTVTDTWDQTADDALDQAEYDYPGVEEWWVRS